MKKFLYHENGWRMFQAEELPMKPIPSWYPGAIGHYDNAVKQYESEIAALKAKSIPIENILVWKLWACQNILEEVLTSDIGIHEWPGDVEIKEILSPGWVPTYNDPDNWYGHPNTEPMEVAILTLPKEPLP